MPINLAFLICAAFLLLVSPLRANDETTEWAVAGGEIVLELNQGMLRSLGVDVKFTRPLGLESQPKSTGHQTASFEGLTLQEIRFVLNGDSIENFTGGYLQYHGGLTLRIGENSLDATDFRMEPHPDLRNRFRLLDREGNAWAILDHGHFELVEAQSALEIRYANLSVSQDLAALIGDMRLIGQVIGSAHVRAPVTRRSSVSHKGSLQCSEPNWSSSKGFDTDISLIDMSQYSNDPAVGAVGCDNCDGQGSGIVAITPNATLENTGTADVPWYEQFTDPQPPYQNDQHAYLIWNLYRMSGGQFEQIGVSGLKHAFFSINVNCPCAGGNIVWVGCQDVYSIASNNIDRYLAPRNEVIPATAQWGRCGSLFDADCDGVQEPTGRSDPPFENRMLVNESDLLDPDARYFIEAWYVVRDDVNRFNTMGWREIDPQWTDMIWTFPVLGPFNAGSAIDAWMIASSAPDDDAVEFDRTTIETPDGALTIAVRAAEIDNAWQYDYFVMNHDYMRTETTGSEPNLAILSNIGLSALEIEHPAADAVFSTSFAHSDPIGGSNWQASLKSQSVQWEGSAANSLDWGQGFRFSVTSDLSPSPGTARLIPGDGSDSFTAEILAPIMPRTLFSDGFESQP